MSYWQESVEIALEEAGVAVSKEQLDIIIGSIEVSHENYGMAHGHDCIPNPLVMENTKLKEELKNEQSKHICKECKGKGTITTYGGTFECTSQCDVCRGEGKTNRY